LEAALDDAEGTDFDGDAVSVGDDLIDVRRDAAARGNDAHEVEGISTAHQDGLLRGRLATNGAEGLNRRGKSELLADETHDEAAAANLAPRLQATRR
jgi:hypothetical protein